MTDAPSFALIFSPGRPLVFRPLVMSAAALLAAQPRIRSVIRAMSVACRGEKVDEWTVIERAKDLEEMLRIVAQQSELSVRPMIQTGTGEVPAAR